MTFFSDVTVFGEKEVHVLHGFPSPALRLGPHRRAHWLSRAPARCPQNCFHRSSNHGCRGYDAGAPPAHVYALQRRR